MNCFKSVFTAIDEVGNENFPLRHPEPRQRRGEGSRSGFFGPLRRPQNDDCRFLRHGSVPNQYRDPEDGDANKRCQAPYRIEPNIMFSDVIRDMNQDSTRIAQEWCAEKKKIGIIQVLFRMATGFLGIYFVQGGLRRGFDGFRDAVNRALFELFCYAKYWELIEQEKGRM
ncbi:MAG: hypothetical protein A3G87_09420 [Omnitrophica bacterium RIFCSPLOWO2_12_FULL_50_11]|nr:MAG: hypothetical protein A3G87_09420 [Omnitrophica bacterium RIFCSPLOWO2_12_FULL_50_11]